MGETFAALICSCPQPTWPCALLFAPPPLNDAAADAVPVTNCCQSQLLSTRKKACRSPPGDEAPVVPLMPPQAVTKPPGACSVTTLGDAAAARAARQAVAAAVRMADGRSCMTVSRRQAAPGPACRQSRPRPFHSRFIAAPAAGAARTKR